MPTAAPLPCRHLHTDGRQCGSPALRHQKLCYQHHSARQRPAHTPSLPDPEDLHAVQRGLAELLRLVARELLDDRQAKRLFLILTAAGTNLARIDRQRARSRELALRERLLALAEARFAVQHPQAKEAGHPPFATASSSPREDREAEPPVTDIVHDPELGPLAPGADPDPIETDPTDPTDPGCPTFGAASPRLRWEGNTPQPAPETETGCPTFGAASPRLRWEGNTPQPAPETETGCPTFGAASPRLRWEGNTPQPAPETPTHARQAELQAEAAAEAEFQRLEEANREIRRQLQTAAREVLFQNLSPEDKVRENARRAADLLDFYGHAGPYPEHEITPQPL